jgi:uncharacterized protein (DUF952 family)
LLILHIARRAEWEVEQTDGFYSPANFEREGFIHASLPEQILGSAQKHYRGQRDLVLLGIDSRRVQAKIRFENLVGGSQQFPHIYGKLNRDAVIGATPFEANDEGEFSLPLLVPHWQQIADAELP